MWITVHLVKGKESVVNLRKRLEDAGILVIVRKKTEEENEEDSFYEILVPQTEAEKAQEMIICER